MTSNSKTVASYFNANWQRYKNSVNKNTLYHQEMFAVLNQFLEKHFGKQEFSLIDIGCGDCSSIAPILKNKSVTKYIGVDAAAEVLGLAKEQLASVSCEKEFICNDMVNAIEQISGPIDIIFTSYAVHHLTTEQKFNFIQSCKNKLSSGGALLMIDGVLLPNQTRTEWLNTLEKRIIEVNPNIDAEELTQRMSHPRADDHPDTVDFFQITAQKQQWASFKILLDKGIFVFIAFQKESGKIASS